jgi:hypothetical protein
MKLTRPLFKFLPVGNIDLHSKNHKIKKLSPTAYHFKQQFVWLLFKNPILASKKITLLHYKAEYFNLMLFKEIVTVYSQNQTKSINILCAKNAELLNTKPYGKYTAGHLTL